MSFLDRKGNLIDEQTGNVIRRGRGQPDDGNAKKSERDEDVLPPGHLEGPGSWDEDALPPGHLEGPGDWVNDFVRSDEPYPGLPEPELRSNLSYASSYFVRDGQGDLRNPEDIFYRDGSGELRRHDDIFYTDGGGVLRRYDDPFYFDGSGELRRRDDPFFFDGFGGRPGIER